MNLEVPKEFYSDSDEKPFINCKVCNQDLSHSNIPYTIEKAFKRIDENRDITLFEIAICVPCAEKQAQKMSKESKAYMESILGNKDFIEKRQNLWESDWENHWKDTCLFTNDKIKLNDEYHIVGHFQNNKLIPFAAPFIIGNDFIEEIQENLSVETKEEMDRFGQQFLGPDPSLRELLPEYQFILV